MKNSFRSIFMKCHDLFKKSWKWRLFFIFFLAIFIINYTIQTASLNFAKDSYLLAFSTLTINIAFVFSLFNISLTLIFNFYERQKEENEKNRRKLKDELKFIINDEDEILVSDHLIEK